ncbi:poly-beta-1,6 N-acetyl-D-glucosamine export porin PgaA [Ectopseudomonas mendocina]|uniref:Poly-beta-1,6 N-acetyl-D-glucosamine export porin PgaA n=1 Tax=Ectopseudomonas mendocina TaxID=300 RepID=A0ABZ2RNV0_ECTME
MLTQDTARRVDNHCARGVSVFKIHLLCSSLLFSTWVQSQPLYDALLEKARAGDYAPALNFLREQRSEASPRYLIDHLLIAGWAGEDAEATALYERQRDHSGLTADALATVARAYRNQKQWPQALQVYREGVSRFPDHEGLQLGRVMTLADAGKFTAAIARGRTLVNEAPQNPDRRLALAYAYQASGQTFAAHAEVDRALEVAPQREDVLREYLFSLQRAGMPQPALSLAERHPGVLSPAQIRQLQGDLLAEQVRFSDLSTRAESERYQVADQALTRADTLLKEWQALSDARADVQRIRIDRMGALHTQGRMPEVLDEYRQLQAEQVDLPIYAKRWVASAALYMRHPELAAELYEQVVAAENDKHPEWLEDNRSLFYARVESWQLEEAKRQADSLAATQPPRLYQLGNPEPESNANWLDAQVLRAVALMENNDLPGAEQILADLLNRAPNNTSLRTNLASLYLARGWPRRAEDELKVAESVNPRSPALEVEQGMAALELQEWRQADVLTEDVVDRYPETLPVQRLERLHSIHEMAELRVNGYRGQGSGSAVSGGDSMGIDTVLYSPPINSDWRVFAGFGYATGDFDEGRGRDRWQRAGAEWRVRNHTLEAEVSRHDYGEGDKIGARLSGTHDIDDYWQYGWSADYLSADTPLRALNSGVSSNSVSGFVRWRGDERREWRLSSAVADFSDGNNRFGLVLDGYQRFYSRPTWQADWGLELAYNSNSRDNDVPYFNPKSEVVVLPRLRLQQTLHQRYETAWTQQLELGAGTINQRYYGTDAVGLISYWQRLRLDDRFEGGLGISALSRAYDGDREQEISLLFDVNYRF